MLVSNLFGCLCLLPVLFVWDRALREFTGIVWLFLGLTGVFQAVYYIALAGAYRNGDLSVAYPLARSSPVLIVAAVTALLGRGKPVSGLALAGMSLIVAGCLILPMRRFSDIRLRNYWNLMSLLALTAACGTAGYSIIDAEAMAVLRPDGGGLWGGVDTLALYALLEGLVTSAWLAAFVLIWRPERRALFGLRRSDVWTAARVGVGIVAAYVLVLFAMRFVTNVSYVVAFRLLSIPLGALLGVAVLKEPPHLPKFAGVAVAFVGLILVGLG